MQISQYIFQKNQILQIHSIRRTNQIHSLQTWKIMNKNFDYFQVFTESCFQICWFRKLVGVWCEIYSDHVQISAIMFRSADWSKPCQLSQMDYLDLYKFSSRDDRFYQNQKKSKGRLPGCGWRVLKSMDILALNAQ